MSFPKAEKTFAAFADEAEAAKIPAANGET